MPAGGVAQVIAELVLILIARYRKRCDGGNKLVVAKRLKSGDGAVSRAEGESQRETKLLVARLRVLQRAGPKGEGTQPGRTEHVLLIQGNVQIIGVRACPRRR